MAIAAVIETEFETKAAAFGEGFLVGDLSAEPRRWSPRLAVVCSPAGVAGDYNARPTRRD
jgi:hypothetical protein